MRKNTHILNFVHIRPVGDELLHADGQADKTKLLAAFLNFTKVPKTLHTNVLVQDGQTFLGAGQKKKKKILAGHNDLL